MRFFQMLRILRMVRIARTLRFIPAFKEMWFLIRGMIESWKTLVWTMLIVFSMLYIFGTVAVVLIGRRPEFIHDDTVQDLFGDVHSSIFTLFQIMTFDSWTRIARPIMRKEPWTLVFFLIFVAIGVFVLMNLITAVIVENAFSIAKEDEEEMAKQMLQKSCLLQICAWNVLLAWNCAYF